MLLVRVTQLITRNCTKAWDSPCVIHVLATDIADARNYDVYVSRSFMVNKTVTTFNHSNKGSPLFGVIYRLFYS